MHLAEKILLMQPLAFGGDYHMCPSTRGSKNDDKQHFSNKFTTIVTLEVLRGDKAA
jgi:hypothetical protein